jgi:hypothetical protein
LETRPAQAFELALAHSSTKGSNVLRKRSLMLKLR